jgi:DNA-binding response OmpR family regulator
MPPDPPRILYVGRRAEGRALHDYVRRCGWQVYLPEATAEALGMYVFYAPDVIVLDVARAPDTAWESYRHLRTVDAGPLLLLTDDDIRDRAVTTLPAAVDRIALADRIAALYI